ATRTATPAPVVQRPDGSVAFTRAGRTHVVRGAILARYRAAGAQTGALGWPTSSEVSLTGGAVTTFERGAVYWSPATGAQVVLGAVRDTWTRLGAERSPLGFPRGEEVRVRDGGVVQAFTGGLVLWHPATGAHEVRGAILERYLAEGREGSSLGFPTTGEIAIRGGAFTALQGGAVYWSPATGAHVVRGAIREAWARLGWEGSALGYPTSEEVLVPGGVRQDYQGGSLTYRWDSRAVTVAVR
ncbi:LGFP repeat-containing protein, partial [Kineococcus glutinatus]|uniref:LGFP repeat-containing protein n=1 Tax=Kineococcus glutinatus TaxID=1070872 RepID=UPI003CD09FA4